MRQEKQSLGVRWSHLHKVEISLAEKKKGPGRDLSTEWLGVIHRSRWLGPFRATPSHLSSQPADTFSGRGWSQLQFGSFGVVLVVNRAESQTRLGPLGQHNYQLGLYIEIYCEFWVSEQIYSKRDSEHEENSLESPSQYYGHYLWAIRGA